MNRPFRAPLFMASLAAGPIFVVSTTLAALYLQLPRVVDVTVGPAQIGWLILVPVLVIPFGFALAIVPNAVGVCLLLLAGFEFPAARTRIAWIGTGMLFGALIAWATTGFDEPAIAFGLISTSAFCAAICRRSARWDPDEPFPQAAARLSPGDDV